LTRLRRFVRKYPNFSFVALGTLLGTLFSAINKHGISNLLFASVSIVSLIPAVKKSSDTLRYGYFGIYLLPILGIITALVLKETETAALLALLISIEKPAVDLVLKRSKPVEQKGISLRVVRHAPFVRLLDKASLPYMILVILIGGGVWVAAKDSSRFLEIIAAASTAPLLLAAPIVITTGVNKLFGSGIKLTSAVVFERLGSTQTLVLKKTGLLVSEDNNVSKVVAFGKNTKQDVVRVAAALASSSSHHLANAIVEYAGEHQKINRAKHVQETQGMGLEGRMKSINLLIGSMSFLESRGIEPPKKRIDDTGPIVYVAENDEVIGYISFEETLLPGVKDLRKQLDAIGISKTIITSGSSLESTSYVAKQAGFKTWHAEAKPSEIIGIIGQITERPVTFVGDDVKDAAIMTAADVSIASTELPTTAQVAIKDFSPVKLLESLKISKQAMRKSWLLSVGGLCMALLIIVVAASGLLSPVQTAAINILFSLTIVLASSKSSST
jgi:P-type E1-E2 ATPase